MVFDLGLLGVERRVQDWDIRGSWWMSGYRVRAVRNTKYEVGHEGISLGLIFNVYIIRGIGNLFNGGSRMLLPYCIGSQSNLSCPWGLAIIEESGFSPVDRLEVCRPVIWSSSKMLIPAALPMQMAKFAPTEMKND